jgi:hypothetical protein
MAPRTDDESPATQEAHPVLVGLAALVVFSLLVGGIISLIALGAAKVSGIDGSAAGGPSVAPSLYMPTGEPTTTPDSYVDPSDFPQPSPSATESDSASAEPSPSERSRTITLQLFPARVSPGERINLTGVYAAGEGAVLQVQRFENGWTDFPVSANVSGGIFNTFVITSRTGQARFRVIDHALNRASNPVTVTVG